MPVPPTSAPGVQRDDFVFRCIACANTSDSAGQDFRCQLCGDLLEITYPRWKDKDAKPESCRLKSAWRDRRSSSNLLDLSGVWRFRDLLPRLDTYEQVISLREGNTPLYELPRC